MQAVLFDLWATLISDGDPQRSRARRDWRAAGVQQVLREAGLDCDYDAVDQALVQTGVILNALHDEGRDEGIQGRLATLSRQLEETTGVAPPREIWPRLERSLCTIPPEYFPGPADHAVEALDALKTLGLRTALVSNAGVTTSPTLRLMLAEHGTLPCLDELVFSDEVGVAKPAARIFQHAARLLNVSPEQSVFVGDSPHNDIYGARNAGMFTVQVGRRTHESVTPDLRIDSLAELVPALAGRGLIAAPPVSK